MTMQDDGPKQRKVGIVNMNDIREVSGLEYLRGIAEGRFPVPAMGRTLKFHLSEVGEGLAVFTGIPDADCLNPMGTVHGGYAATLLDSALACAVQTLCPPGYASTSIELKVNFVRPIKVDTGRLICRGNVVHPGRQIATSEAKLTNEAGKLFAHGTQTCSVFRIPD